MKCKIDGNTRTKNVKIHLILFHKEIKVLFPLKSDCPTLDFKLKRLATVSVLGGRVASVVVVVVWEKLSKKLE
jgi:hypothetical protein